MKKLKALLLVSVALNILLIFKVVIFFPSKEVLVTVSDKFPSTSVLWPSDAPHKLVKSVTQRAPPEEGKITDFLSPAELAELARVWVYNKTAADGFRDTLENCCNASHTLLVTKTNTPVNTIIQYDAERKSRLNVTREILGRFVKDTPLTYKKYSSCSVVGNGGLLKDSGCGKEIDSTDFVFRCNMAPVDEQFLADVGNKTNLITMNPTIIKDRYGRLKTAEMKEKFVQDMWVYGGAYVFMPAFAFRMCTPLSFSVQTTLQEYNTSLTTVFGNPTFMTATNKFWKSNGVKARRISSGLFLASAALSICEEVRLYGFWPFHVDKNNKTLTEHYYDNRLPHKMHKLPDEFRKLRQLHNKGILHHRTDACS